MSDLIKEKKHSNEAAWIMVAISSLLCLGALMVYSAGATVDRQIDYSKFWQYTTLRRIVFVPIVLLVLAVASRMNYRIFLINEKRFWLSPVILYLIISLVFLLMSLVKGLGGVETNYSSRWLILFGIKFQPSELVKWMTVFFLSGWLVYNQENVGKFWKGFVPGFGVLGLMCGLIGKEDFGTAALLGLVGTVLLLTGGVKARYLLLLVPIAVAGFYFGVYKVEYRWERVLAHFDPSKLADAASDARYQGDQSVMAISVGGLYGTGLGQGLVKLGWLPEDTTDFIFAIIAEELGFVGCVIIVGLYLMLVFQGLRMIKKCECAIGKLIGLSVTAMISCQALINLFVVSGMAPTKGIALPFISAGGTGLVVTALAYGVLINVARTSTKEVTSDELRVKS